MLVEPLGDTRLPLKEIMVGLENDLARVSGGLWREDTGSIREGARRVADHPRVVRNQMSAIQAALADDFAAFAGLDQVVHRSAVELVEAVDSSRTTEEMFEIFLRIQRGCVSCHETFRERVGEALGSF